MESGWNVWVWLVGAQVKSMDDNCGEWVECMGVARRWVWLVGVGGIYGCGYWVWL